MFLKVILARSGNATFWIQLKFIHTYQNSRYLFRFWQWRGVSSIVLAVLLCEENPDIEIHLIESDGRKAAFLRTALRELKVPGMVWGKRVQEVKLSPARVVTARAVAPLADLLFYGSNTYK